MKKTYAIGLGLVLAACAGTPNKRVPIRSVTTPQLDDEAAKTDLASDLARQQAEAQASDAEAAAATEREAAERDRAVREAEEAAREAAARLEAEQNAARAAAEAEIQRQIEAGQQPQQPGVDVAATPFGAVCSYKIGNPYLIDGVSYFPHEDYAYSEIGMASWYGPNFHGGNTANGEVFDETKYTAAHRTLPMPSLVRVSNLENGVSLNVKINDRGPFARDRILDLSSAAAEVLGVKEHGQVRVRVDILEAESRQLKELAMACQNTDIYEPDVRRDQPQHSPPPAPVYNEPAADALAADVPATSNGDYFVQIAAYSSYDKAEALKVRIAHIGQVKIFKAKQGDGVLYKVRLGEYATKAEAQKAKESIDRAGIAGSRVIMRDDGSFNWNP